MTTTDGRSQLRKGGREMLIPTQALILRFRIELLETDPLIWRAIEVPGDSSFWDLHVAIQGVDVAMPGLLPRLDGDLLGGPNRLRLCAHSPL